MLRRDDVHLQEGPEVRLHADLAWRRSISKGLIDLAAKRGLKTLAVIHEDTLFPKAVTQGALELAKKRGLQAVVVEAYPRKTTDFSAILARVKAGESRCRGGRHLLRRRRRDRRGR